MNNNKNEQHLSAGELAGLPGLPISIYGVHKRAASRGWPSRPRVGQGGGREYPISCLPVETQAALAARLLQQKTTTTRGSPIAPGVPTPESGETPDPRSESLAAVFDAKPEKLKAEARARLGIVREYYSLLSRGFSKEHVEAAVTREREISTATLWRYLGLIKGKPEQLWLHELCPAYAGRTALAAMSAEAWEYLKSDYLRPERPAAAACIFRAKRAAAKHGWTLPSERTMLRRLNGLPRAVKVLAREGKQAALQLYPAQARSRAALCALAIVNADGYKHNVWTVFADGEVGRAKTWFWQDVYSSKVLGWLTDKTEHTDLIRLSLGDLVERYGIPERVLLDNTMAAANKTMSGGVKHRYRFKVRDEEPWGVFKLLGIEGPIWATPRHGQAKPVERAFGIGGIGELVDKAPDLAGAWTGGNTQDKPEYAEGRGGKGGGKNRAVPLAELEAVIAREVAAFNAKQGRRSPMHRGRSFDEVFAESYARSTIRRATEAQRRLWLLATEPVTAGRRDGAITLDAGRITRSDAAPTQANRYWHADLVDHGGRQVVARFDPRRLHEGVHVYTIDGRYLCYAECFAPQGFDDQAAGREHQRDRRTYMRAAQEQLAAERRMDARTAAKFLPGGDRPAAEATIPAPKVVRAEFRDPLERPRVQARALDAGEQRFMDELETTGAAPAQVSVHELHSDKDKHAYWTALDARRTGGETLAEGDEEFWKAWQQSAFFRIQTELDQEFQQRMATGG